MNPGIGECSSLYVHTFEYKICRIMHSHYAKSIINTRYQNAEGCCGLIADEQFILMSILYAYRYVGILNLICHAQLTKYFLWFIVELGNADGID